jgi:hypothetical protein
MSLLICHLQVNLTYAYYHLKVNSSIASEERLGSSPTSSIMRVLIQSKPLYVKSSL